MTFLSTTSARHILYELKGGYLLLPMLIMLLLSTLAGALPQLEEHVPIFAKWAQDISWLVPKDPGMAQLILGAIAGSCITIVSVVYSVLLIALTFASIQFSPRILTSFLKDRISQSTLGIFIGTFAYCLILFPSIRGGAQAFVPILSLSCALFLASICLLYLIYFIHHIAMAIQANYIVDRIARETEGILRTLFGGVLKGFPAAEEPIHEPQSGKVILCQKSGYVQFLAENKLIKLAIEADASIYVFRSVGQFIPAGVPCISITPAAVVTDELAQACLDCFHIGPLRSMEADIEFGVLQTVDIALKAISPAVNDPSTAMSCIDQMSAMLILAATLEPPSARVFDNAGTMRLMRRQTSFPRLLEIAYNQIMPYGKGDMAVSLRLMRALHDISGVTNFPLYLSAIRNQAQRICKSCSLVFSEEDCAELYERLTIIEKRQRSAS